MSGAQPEALRLAEMLEVGRHKENHDAGAELRRLHALNAELVEALEYLLASHADYTESQARGWPHRPGGYPDHDWSLRIDKSARAALAKAKAQP